MSENLWPSKPPKEAASDLLRSCSWEMAGDAGEGAYKAAYYLFQELIEHIGVDDARRVFLHFGKTPSKSRLNQIKNDGLLILYDLMKKPNVQKLAEQIAEENRSLPRDQRRGPTGSTSVATIDKHLRRLIRLRDDRRQRAQTRIRTF